MKREILKLVIIPIVVIMLLMTDFIILGHGMAIAIYEELEIQNTATNVKNVEFDAYFLDNGEKIHKKENALEAEETLILSVNVKDRGLLKDAKIKIANENFTILKEKVSNGFVKNINLENGEIELNQIIYQNKVTIELPIQFKKQTNFEEDYFEKENTISITGIYEDTKEQEVFGEVKTRMIWKQETDVTFTNEVEKFIDLGEDGVLLQQKVTTKVFENKLPRENEELELGVPMLKGEVPESVSVLLNGQKLPDEQVTYQKENKTLQIKTESKGVWGKGDNEYKIIYQYTKGVEVETNTISFPIKMTTKLYTQENVEKSEESIIEVAPMGNVVSLKKSATESIYKGYFYAGTTNETQYDEWNTVEVSQTQSINTIEMNENQEVALDENQNQFDLTDKTLYQSTIINQENMKQILGEEGSIVIKDAENNIITMLNQQSQADENGNIVVSYEEPVKRIKLEISNPVSVGTLTIQHKKAIEGNTGYTKNQLKTLVKMNTSTNVTTNLAKEEVAKTEINLLDTKTEAKIEMNHSNLSTLEKNENVQFLVTLKSNQATYDLYKNPKVEIVLPKELKTDVKNITQLNRQEELQIVNPKLYLNENGQQVIHLELQGEQTTFENDVNQGIQLVIAAEITMDKTTPSKQTEIVMNYTNENREGETFQAEVPVQLHSKYGVLMVNQLSNYNQNQEVLESIDNKVKTGTLDIEGEEQVATQEIGIVNNYETPITGIVMIGRIPSSGEEKINQETVKANFEMKLLEGIHVEGKNAKIYYSEDAKATNESDSWTENLEDITKARAYKIEIEDNTIEPGQAVKVSYPLQIPGNLENDAKTYTNIDLSYNYGGNLENTNATIYLTTPELNQAEEIENSNLISQENKEGISAYVFATADEKALQSEQEVYVGQAIQYKVKVTNHSENTIHHVKVVASHTNGIFYDAVKKLYINENGEVEDDQVYLTFIEENPELKEKEFIVESLNPGETKEFDYQISVAKVETEGQELTGTIHITADEQEDQEINLPNNPIIDSQIKATLKSSYHEDVKIYSNQAIAIEMDVKNMTTNPLQDVMVEMKLPEEVYFTTEQLPIDEESKYEFVEYKDKVLKIKIKEIDPDETIQITTKLITEKLDTSLNETNTSLVFKASVNDREYYSNKIYKTILQSETVVKANQTANIKREYVQDKDELIFTTEIENAGNKEVDLYLEDILQDGLKVKESYVENNGEKIDMGTNNNNAGYITLKEGTKAVWTIVTEVQADLVTQRTITNYASIQGTYVDITTDPITYLVKGKEDLPEENPNATYSIQGTVWLDENKNGTRELNEKTLANIPVYLMDANTNTIAEDSNKNQMKTTTDSTGNYTFSNLAKGNYIAIFQYDTTKYTVTEYQKQGISEMTNSDVISDRKTIEGEEKLVAVTKNLSVTENNLTNIDAGLVELEVFDLKLDKYVNKIIVQTNKGTTVRQYEKEQLAKIELDSKTMANTTLLVEYKIVVTNEGEIPGYANEIVDYKPSDLTFSSEMNTNWFQSTDQNLYSRELANQIINPGETKEITLTLIKKMNQNNSGTIINTAEINKASNSNAIEDKDSIPGNKNTAEDDISTANVIVSIRTGSAVIYTMLIIIVVGILAIGIYMIKKEVLTEE